MLTLEHHCLDRRYATLRTTSRAKERRLLASLAQNGQLVPVVVVATPEANRYVLIDGYKRARALQQLHSDVVQAMVWELGEPEALICERLLRRADRDGPLEQGWLLHELQQRFQLSLGELARRFDVSTSWVSRRLALVQQLPGSVHEAVRAGRIVAHAAQKYLVPLARANREHATKLSERIGALELSTREVGALYAAYQQADNEEGKNLVVTRPELVLRAHQQSAATHSDPHPDPVERLENDLRILTAVTRRTCRTLREEFIKRLPQTRRQRFKLAIDQAALDIHSFQTAFGKEYPSDA